MSPSESAELIRELKDRSGPGLLVCPSAWRAFVQDVQVGGFDHG